MLYVDAKNLHTYALYALYSAQVCSVYALSRAHLCRFLGFCANNAFKNNSLVAFRKMYHIYLIYKELEQYLTYPPPPIYMYIHVYLPAHMCTSTHMYTILYILYTHALQMH